MEIISASVMFSSDVPLTWENFHSIGLESEGSFSNSVFASNTEVFFLRSLKWEYNDWDSSLSLRPVTDSSNVLGSSNTESVSIDKFISHKTNRSNSLYMILQNGQTLTRGLLAIWVRYGTIFVF